MLVYWMKRYWSGIIMCFSLTVLILAQGAPEVSSKEWKEKRATFEAKYKSKAPEKRFEAMEMMEELFGRFEKGTDALEATQLMLDAISSETNEEVAEVATSCLAKLPEEGAALKWILMSLKVITKLSEKGKLRFIEALSQFDKKHKEAVEILIELTKDKSPNVRREALTPLSELLLSEPQLASSEILLALSSLTPDKEDDICTMALGLLAELKDEETIPYLIKALQKEHRREEIKLQIGQALEAITKQSYGTDVRAWQKWWKQPVKDKVPQAEVDQAINKGKNYLLQQGYSTGREAELVFYTLIHAGMSRQNSLLQTMLSKPLEKTYNVALLAMALCDLDKVKYQARLVQCAHFLLGNQSPDGNWRYGKPIKDRPEPPSPIPTDETTQGLVTDKDSSSSTKGLFRAKTSTTSAATKKEIQVPRQPRARTDWDNSNTQYALLGLRACAEAGIVIPKETWRDAENHHIKTQGSDGGWSYQHGRSYGSMTAGGLSSLAICLHYQGKSVKKDSRIRRGLQWLAENFTVRENPFKSEWHYYYLYALERAGVICDTEFLGKNEWYQIGARYLLGKQSENGSWNNNVIDTCFAILFLRRATKKLPPKYKPTITGE